MVRKSLTAFFICAMLVSALGGRASAAEFEVSESIPTSVLQYARDIVSNAKFVDNYLLYAIESEGETAYALFVGEVTYNAETNEYTLGRGVEHFFFNMGYGNHWVHYPNEYDDINVTIANPNYYLIYSDLGNNPELMSTGEKYEVLQTYTLCAVVLFGLCVRIFGKR